MLRDWDLQSTLLRRAVQARRAPCRGRRAGRRSSTAPSDVAALERRILADAPRRGGGWVDAPAGAGRAAADRRPDRRPVSAGPDRRAAAALTGARRGWLRAWLVWTGLALMLLATPLDGIAERLARAPAAGRCGRAGGAAAAGSSPAAALLALAYALAPTHGWGMILLACDDARLPVRASGRDASGRAIRGRGLLAERKGMSWLMLPSPSSAAGMPAWPCSSLMPPARFFWAQRHAHRPAPRLRISGSLTLSGLWRGDGRSGTRTGGTDRRCRAAAAGGGARAFCRGRDRSAAARAARLTEWQRLTAAALLGRLVRAIEDDLRARLAAHFAAQEALARRSVLGPCPDRRADPRAGRGAARPRAQRHPGPPRRGASLLDRAARRGRDDLLFALVRDADEDDRRRGDGAGDRPQPPLRPLPGAGAWARSSCPPSSSTSWSGSSPRRFATISSSIIASAAVDAAIEEAAARCIAGYDEGESLEAGRCGWRGASTQPAGSTAISLAADDRGRPAAVVHRRRSPPLCALDQAAAWEVLSDPRGRGPALLLRAAGLERARPPRILLALNARGPLFSGAEGDAAAAQLELFDTLDRAVGAARCCGCGSAHPGLSRQRRPHLDPRPPGRGGMSDASTETRRSPAGVDGEGG